jgi:hypothetical protein
MSQNLSDPLNYWPKGNYTLAITTACGTSNLTVTVKGFTANLSGNTITPVCGGFNYLMNGTFDVQSAYQVIIVSGPASVGQTRDLASTSASLPFNGLVDGNYVFGLRIKGGVTNVLTQVVTYSAANAVKKTFRANGIRLPKRYRTPKAKAISVAIGIPHPFWYSVP